MSPDPFKKARSEVHSKIEPDEFAGNTLGGKFGNTIIRIFKKFTNSITDWFEERLINFAVGVLVKVEQSGKTIFSSLIKELKKNNAIPDFMKPIFDEIENPKYEIGAILSGAAGQTAIGGLFGAIFDPLMASTKYTLNKLLKPYQLNIDQAVMGKLFGQLGDEDLRQTILAQGFRSEFAGLFTALYKNKIPFAELVELLHRGKITDVLFTDRLRLLGFEDLDITILKNLIYKIPAISESIISYFRGETSEAELNNIAEKNGIDTDFLKILLSANRQLLGLSDIKAIYYREHKSEQWLTDQLKGFGFNKTDLEDLTKVFPYFPAVPDLISFAVREVYTPEIVSKYGQLEDLPDKFLEEAKKAGLPEEQAKNYWAAHWILPSLLMGYEMLHRGVISEEELKVLMRTQDIMPYWRDKLIEISYNPLTRVDVRRMFNRGTIGEAEVLEAYKAVGYNDKNAQLMTEFTKAYYQPAEKRSSKADILDGYTRKFLNYDETAALLLDLGYDTDEIDLYLSKVDYKEAQDNKKEALKITEDMYKKAVLDDNGAISILTTAGVEMAEINYHIQKWSIAKISKPSKPSKENLKSWLTLKIIDREFYITEMRSLGYADKYINNYLLEAKQKGL